MWPYHDLNDEERREYDHSSMINMGWFGLQQGLTAAQQLVYRKAHDRIYGHRDKCEFCQPAFLNDLAKAFRREAVGPTTTLAEKRLAVPSSGWGYALPEVTKKQ